MCVNLCVFFAHGKYLGVEWLDILLGVYLMFQETDKLFSKVVVSFCIPSLTVLVSVLVATHRNQHLKWSVFLILDI